MAETARTDRGGQAEGSGPGGPAGENRRPDEGDTLVRPPLRQEFKDAVRTVRGQLHHDSPVFRHAVRATVVVVVVGDLIGRALPFGHSYWVPLVAILIMRPGFSHTYGRAAARLGGTLVGLVIAGGIVQLAQPGPAVSGILSVICGGLILLFMYTGYAPVQVAASGYVVFTFAMAGVGLDHSVPARLILTLVGGCLAMLAYAVCPAWETPRLRTRLADWIKADLVYAATVVRHYADPTQQSARETREAVLSARTCVLAWRNAVALAEQEPVRQRGFSRTTESGAEQAPADFAHTTMLLEAHLPAPASPRQPAWRPPCSSRPKRVSSGGRPRPGS